MKKMYFGLFFGLYFLVFASQNLWAATQVAFDASPDERVVGYKLYYGQTPDFSEIVDLETNTHYDLPQLVKGATYYFAATGYDEDGNESAFSEILEYQVPADPIIIPDVTGIGVKRLLPATGGENHLARFTWNVEGDVDGYLVWTSNGSLVDDLDWKVKNFEPDYAIYPESPFLDIPIQAWPETYYIAVVAIKNGIMGYYKEGELNEEEEGKWKNWYKPGDVNRNGIANSEDSNLIYLNYGQIPLDEPVNSQKTLSNLHPNEVVDRYDRARLRLFVD